MLAARLLQSVGTRTVKRMPSHSHVLHACSAEEFCEALRELRERQRITLDTIAEATKIPAYMFDGLEHNDLRRWPNGLFRRSFFRDYAHAIGLPVAEACAEFVRFFPEAEPAPVPAETAAPAPERRTFWVLLKQWLTDSRPASGVRVRIKMPR
jgi:cytoskeletal protein RodZ